MKTLSGKKISECYLFYENIIVVDKSGKQYFLKKEHLMDIVTKAMKEVTFEVTKKRTRTWLVPNIKPRKPKHGGKKSSDSTK